jgi:hypothetical protein
VLPSVAQYYLPVNTAYSGKSIGRRPSPQAQPRELTALPGGLYISLSDDMASTAALKASKKELRSLMKSTLSTITNESIQSQSKLTYYAQKIS